jgi:hypothetical protein
MTTIKIDGYRLGKAFAAGSSIEQALGLHFNELSVAQQTDIINGIKASLTDLSEQLHQIEGVKMTFDVSVIYAIHPSKNGN